MNSRFLSLDIETTGLNPETCQIIEIGAVIDNWLSPLENPPTYQTYVTHPDYRGNAYALSMHPKILRRIATGDTEFRYVPAELLAIDFARWLISNNLIGKIVVAGKNFAGFDARFLSKIDQWDELIKFHYRVLDPAMLCWNPLKDSVLPSSKDCMNRCNLPGEVAHTALEDAIIVAKMIQKRVALWKILNVGSHCL